MPLHFRSCCTALAVILTLCPPAAAKPRPQAGAPAYDLVIENGRVMDGTGNPWFLADIGVREGRIAAIGDLHAAKAKTRIDAHREIVAPGFIDMHSHADGLAGRLIGLRSPDRQRREARNIVTQGVTTVVVNPDGMGAPGLTVAAQQAELAKVGIGPNAALLSPHNTIRLAILGEDYKRKATPTEIAAMRALVRTDMEDGAFGLSTGLEYMPGRWADTDELVALMQEVAPYHGIHSSHMRSDAEAPMWYIPSRDPGSPTTVLDAVAEHIAIAERSHAIGVITHIKARGVYGWGRSREIIAMIDAARARGVQIYADQYTYDTSGSDGKIVLIPGWAMGAPDDLDSVDPVADYFSRTRPKRKPVDRKAALRVTLAAPAAKAALYRDIAFAIRFRGGAEQITVFDAPDRSLIGQSLADLARKRGISAEDMAVALQLEGTDAPGGARLRSFSLDETDIDAFMRQEWTATSSDGGVKLPADGPATHARYYGTFPRKFARYVNERHTLSLAQAVRSSTSLPAQILGLTDRGVLRVGAAADIVVFNDREIRDRADFTNPHQFSTGVDYVFVNGVAEVSAGQATGALAGQPLKHPRP
jgi:N-acyl-D-amino-acid deacylase